MGHQQTPHILHRLARIEGHVHAIQTMVEAGRACPEVLVQIAAVRAALAQVGKLMLEDHIESCVVRSVEQGDAEATLRELKEALAQWIK